MQFFSDYKKIEGTLFFWYIKNCFSSSSNKPSQSITECDIKKQNKHTVTAADQQGFKVKNQNKEVYSTQAVPNHVEALYHHSMLISPLF
jgi:hypothetical protein